MKAIVDGDGVMSLAVRVSLRACTCVDEDAL
jgi:hypothetical protein